MNNLSVLIVGSGGREHALAWKIKQSPRVGEIFAAPGNAGIAEIAACVPIKAEDVEGIAAFVVANDIDLTVIGPEASLAAGIADKLNAMGRSVFGPLQEATQIESSKSFAKDLMQKYHIPTAKYAKFTEVDAAIDYVKEQGAPIVIKADGLAAGKGVVIALTEAEAITAVNDMLANNVFGTASASIVIEEYLTGEEVSILAFCDGHTIVPMVSSQDHKRAFDNDEGPNTGGMGAYSPALIYTPEIAVRVEKEILQPTLAALTAEGLTYKGIIYVGLMLTANGPKVVEYNARFGDPETQPVLMRLKTDLVDIMYAVIEERLADIEIEWYDEVAVCVVMASGGYPGKYVTGYPIAGISVAEEKGAVVFHAGTAKNAAGKTVSAGGRVLGVTAMATDIPEAIAKAYDAVVEIKFKDAFYRRDIGKKAGNRE